MRLLAVISFFFLAGIGATACSDDKCSTDADCPKGRICRVTTGLCALDPGLTDVTADAETFSDVPLNCDPAGSADLVLNEILADPPAGSDVDGNGIASSTEDEFVEVVNVSSREVALSNVEIDVNGKRVALGHLCLGSSSARLLFGSGGLPSLTNSSGAVSLVIDGIVVQSHTYGSEAGRDSSLTLATQLDPSAAWVLHKDVWGAAYSAGTCSNGNEFPDCAGGVVTPDAEVVDGQEVSPDVIADCTQAPVAGDLVINEVMADPGSGAAGNDSNGDGVVDSSDDEFVELVNVSSATLLLDGVKLSDTGTKTFTFPPAVCVEPGQAIVVFGDYKGTGSFPGVLTFAGGGLSLNNSDDGVILKDAAGGELAKMAYASEADADQSIVRATDLDPLAAFVRHSLAANAGGRKMSPGYCQSGSPFPDCPTGAEVVESVEAADVVESVEAVETIDTVEVSETPDTADTADTIEVSETIDDVGPSCGPTPEIGDLVVNEVLFDPPASFDANGDGTPETTQDEFIEIVNVTGGALSIAGVKVGDLQNPGRYTFGAAVCVGPGEAVVVFGKGAKLFAASGVVALDEVVHSLSLNNGPPESVTLTNALGTVLWTEAFAAIPADQSAVRSPELTGSFVGHTTVVAGSPASPGACTNGVAYPACKAP